MKADIINADCEDYMDSLFSKYNDIPTYALEQLAEELAADGKDVESDKIWYIITHR